MNAKFPNREKRPSHPLDENDGEEFVLEIHGSHDGACGFGCLRDESEFVPVGNGAGQAAAFGVQTIQFGRDFG